MEGHLHEDALAVAELVADDGVGRPQHASELPEAWSHIPLFLSEAGRSKRILKKLSLLYIFNNYIFSYMYCV